MTFDRLIPDARAFLSELEANNTRDWFTANKARYDAQLKQPAIALLEDMRPRITKMTGLDAGTKLFRAHRDVRFSKDKRPYNTHLHMMWPLLGEARQNPVFFFGIGLDYVTAGAGVMGLDKPVLADWRNLVDLDTDRILGVIAGLKAAGYALRPPELKRVPAPFDKDHPAGDLLRMKSVSASRDLGAQPNLVTALDRAFDDLWPLNKVLLQAAEA